MHRFALSTVLTALVAMTVGAAAQASTIVVYRPDASDPILTESFSRLCGELHMYGLDVELADHPADHRPSDIGRSTDVVGSVALLRSAGQASATIGITEATTGKESMRITVSIDDADAPSLLAMRAVDLLRASLRDVAPKLEARRRAASELPNDEPTPSAEQPPVRWTVRAGASSLWETGELGAGYAVNVALARRLSSRLALELSLMGPVIGHAYDGAAATANLREEIGTLSLARRLVEGRLALDIVQGFGGAHLDARGEASSPWLDQSSSAWAAVSTTGGHVGLGLSPHLAIGVSVAAVFLLPRPVLEVGNTSYVVHQPMLLVSGGLEYGF
jgi:hypothetical protein